MLCKIIFLFLLVLSIYSSSHDPDLEAKPHALNSIHVQVSESTEDTHDIAHRTRLKTPRVREAHEALSKDFTEHLNSLIKSRATFRTIAGCSEALGNVLLYTGTALTTLSATIKLVAPTPVSNAILFCGTACIVTHVACIGIAKYAAKESSEREALLKDMAETVNFSIVPLPSIIEDGEESSPHLASRSDRKDD